MFKRDEGNYLMLALAVCSTGMVFLLGPGLPRYLTTRCALSPSLPSSRVSTNLLTSCSFTTEEGGMNSCSFSSPSSSTSRSNYPLNVFCNQ